MTRDTILRTLLTLAIGGVGAALATWIGIPAPFLTGPAVLVTLVCLAGVRLVIPVLVRNAAFILIGINIGSGVTPDVAQIVTKWPVAMLALFLMLLAIMTSGALLMRRVFAYSPQSAVLATAPGHLSFVLSMGASLGADVATISIVQSIRVLALTLIVPFAASLAGVSMDPSFLFRAETMSPVALAVLVLAATLIGFVFARIRVPAPFLMAGMVLSAITHLFDVTPGAMPAPLAFASFAVLGTLIGTRFSGVTWLRLRQAFVAGCVLTALSVAWAGLAAWPIWTLLDLEPSHVLVAFAPGGLETMVTMGVFIGADPNFVAAHHVARLFMLALLIPVFVGRAGRRGTQTV